MMQSTARNVNAYLDEVPAERKAALIKLPELMSFFTIKFLRNR